MSELVSISVNGLSSGEFGTEIKVNNFLRSSVVQIQALNYSTETCHGPVRLNVDQLEALIEVLQLALVRCYAAGVPDGGAS